MENFYILKLTRNLSVDIHSDLSMVMVLCSSVCFSLLLPQSGINIISFRISRSMCVAVEQIINTVGVKAVLFVNVHL